MPLALLLTLTLGLVDPGGVRGATPREPVGSLWGVALSRAVEALAEAGECPANEPLPAIAGERISPLPDAPVLVVARSLASRGEGDLPPPASA